MTLGNHGSNYPASASEKLCPSLRERLIAMSSNPRDRALVALLATTGIRISEVIQLKVTDIDFAAGTVNIMYFKERTRLKCLHCGHSLGNGHRFCSTCGSRVNQALRENIEQRGQRTILVAHNTLALIEEYLQWRSRFPYRGLLIFPFTRQRGWQLIKRLGRRVGISGLHPQSLRHLLSRIPVPNEQEGK